MHEIEAQRKRDSCGRPMNFGIDRRPMPIRMIVLDTNVISEVDKPSPNVEALHWFDAAGQVAPCIFAVRLSWNWHSARKGIFSALDRIDTGSYLRA